jgi:hypothetical protein
MNVKRSSMVLLPLFLFNFRLHSIKILQQLFKTNQLSMDCAYFERSVGLIVHSVSYSVEVRECHMAIGLQL